jgi:cbb3-type cytochrome oxidase subunit 3
METLSKRQTKLNLSHTICGFETYLFVIIFYIFLLYIWREEKRNIRFHATSLYFMCHMGAPGHYCTKNLYSYFQIEGQAAAPCRLAY